MCLAIVNTLMPLRQAAKLLATGRRAWRQAQKRHWQRECFAASLPLAKLRKDCLLPSLRWRKLAPKLKQLGEQSPKLAVRQRGFAKLEYCIFHAAVSVFHSRVGEPVAQVESIPAAALCLVSGLRALEGADLARVRMVMFSGEVMPAEHLRRWMDQLPQATFVNLYGPTEVTCNCLYHVVDRDRAYEGGLPLGEPFPGRRVLLLDESGAPVTKPGDAGEIYVGGTALARGYYANPERTAAAFVQNPLCRVLPETLYRTGDLARLNGRGELVFAGRADNQIKLQGHRIELEEVDAALEAQDGVDRCRCVYDERGRRILAFFEGTASPDELRAAVARLVPGPAVPAVMERVDAMPLLPNGKVSRSALLEGYLGRRRQARAKGGERC